MTLQCIKCNKVFKSIRNLEKHVQHKIPCDILIQCIRCDKIFKYQRELDAHTNRKFPCKLTQKSELLNRAIKNTIIYNTNIYIDDMNQICPEEMTIDTLPENIKYTIQQLQESEWLNKPYVIDSIYIYIDAVRQIYPKGINIDTLPEAVRGMIQNVLDSEQIKGCETNTSNSSNGNTSGIIINNLNIYSTTKQIKQINLKEVTIGTLSKIVEEKLLEQILEYMPKHILASNIYSSPEGMKYAIEQAMACMPEQIVKDMMKFIL